MDYLNICTVPHNIILPHLKLAMLCVQNNFVECSIAQQNYAMMLPLISTNLTNNWKSNQKTFHSGYIVEKPFQITRICTQTNSTFIIVRYSPPSLWAILIDKSCNMVAYVLFLSLSVYAYTITVLYYTLHYPEMFLYLLDMNNFPNLLHNREFHEFWLYLL